MRIPLLLLLHLDMMMLLFLFSAATFADYPEESPLCLFPWDLSLSNKHFVLAFLYSFCCCFFLLYKRINTSICIACCLLQLGII